MEPIEHDVVALREELAKSRSDLVQARAQAMVLSDVRAAGANYRDLPVVVDGNIVTGRGPDDLPEFCRAMMRMLRVESRV